MLITELCGDRGDGNTDNISLKHRGAGMETDSAVIPREWCRAPMVLPRDWRERYLLFSLLPDFQVQCVFPNGPS